MAKNGFRWASGIKQVFACWYNFMQIKRSLKILGIDMVKNAYG